MATVPITGGPFSFSKIAKDSVKEGKDFSADVTRDPRVSVIVDGGEGFGELRGVTIEGRAETVGEVPRTGEPTDELSAPELAFARKYMDRDEFVYDGGHAWLRITPEKITSWDFRKYRS